jgi:protein-tyrosine phosphatase
MKNWGISAVVNLRQELDDRRLGLVPDRYLYLPTPDDYAPSLEQLYRAVEFITQEIAAGGKVYVHCGAGVGRAVITAAAYLISTGMSADQALAAIRKRRPFINPSAVQLQRLDEFAADWKAHLR